jgi:S1-C subfamily serine protease
MRCHLTKTIYWAGIALAMMLFSSAPRVSAGEGGWLGITVQNVSPRDAFRLGLNTSRGVVVTMVRQGGPADRGGMKQEDVIVEFDGQPVENVSRLKEMVGKSSPGSRVKIKIIRRRNKTTLSVFMGRKPREAA